MLWSYPKRLVLTPYLLTETLVHCKGGASKGAAAGSGNSGGGTQGSADESPLGNWIVYGPVLTCIFLITLCLLYDKVNNVLRSKRHDESHLTRRDYARGSRKQGHVTATEEDWFSERNSRRTIVEKDASDGTFLPMQSINSGTSNFIDKLKDLTDQAQRKNSEHGLKRAYVDQERLSLDRQATISLMEEKQSNIDDTSPTWDHEILLWEQEQPVVDQQRVWEEKIALLDQKIALLEQEKSRNKHNNLHKQGSLDVKNTDHPSTSKGKSKRQLSSTKSDTVVFVSDHDTSLNTVDDLYLSSNHHTQLQGEDMQRKELENKLKSSSKEPRRPPLLASTSVGI